jgi:hypothetical protein
MAKIHQFSGFPGHIRAERCGPYHTISREPFDAATTGDPGPMQTARPVPCRRVSLDLDVVLGLLVEPCRTKPYAGRATIERENFGERLAVEGE